MILAERWTLGTDTARMPHVEKRTQGEKAQGAMPLGRAIGSIIGMGSLLLIVSVGQVMKFLGSVGVVAYVVAVFAILAAGHRVVVPRFLRQVTEKQALGLAAITILMLLVLFAFVYPIANAGLTGIGSDRDDNLNIATSAMLRGENPYENRGYYMPGTFLLAAPFVMLGNSAWQNLFWIAVFYLASRQFLGDGRLALLLLWALLGLSPAFLQELVTGGDLITNTISVIVLAQLMVGTVGRGDEALWKKVLSAVLFGIVIASRFNFALIVPLVFALLVKRVGWKTAAAYMLVAGGTVAALGIPFDLYNLDHMAMLRFQNRFGHFQRVIPFAKVVIPALAASIALVLAWPRLTKTSSDLLRNATIVLAFPILTGMLLAMVLRGRAGLMFAVQGWGLFFLFSGALYFWARLFETPADADVTFARGVSEHPVQGGQP